MLSRIYSLPIKQNPRQAPVPAQSISLCYLEAGIACIAHISTTFRCYFNVDRTASIGPSSIANVSCGYFFHLCRPPVWRHRAWKWRSCRHGNAGNTTPVVEPVVTTAVANVSRGTAALMLYVVPVKGWNVVYLCQVDVGSSSSL